MIENTKTKTNDDDLVYFLKNSKKKIQVSNTIGLGEVEMIR